MERYALLLPTNLRKKYEEDKLGILDVRVLLNNSTQIDIEIQVSPFLLWPERSLFYLAKMFTDQIEKGEGYEKLEKCVHVGILDFILFGEDKEYYSCFHIREDVRNCLYTDKLEVHILELPKLKKHDYPETELLNWAKFMNAERQEEFEEMAEKDQYIEKAYEALKNISADEEKRLEYEAREKALRDHDYLMKSNWEAGLEAGKKAGEKIGINKGIEQGEGRVNRLIQLLIVNSRTDEIEKAVSDKEYQQALFRELHL